MRGFYRGLESTQLLRDLPEPKPQAGEVLVRVTKAGICDTDLHLARGYMGFTGILGHEFVGRTEGGKRVVSEINNSCHECATCLSGSPNHCPNRSVLGILNHDGAMADWVCAPERNLHAVPDAIDDRSAVFIEPLAAAFRVTEQVRVAPGIRLAVVGDGKLGLLCAWVAASEGAEVHLIGRHPEKLRLAGEGVGVHFDREIGRLRKTFDVVIEASGSTSGLPTALELVRPEGTVVLKTTVVGSHDLALAPIVIDEIRVVGSRCGPFSKALDALAKKRIDVQRLVEAEYSLDDAEEAFAAAGKKGARKIVLDVSE